MILNNRFDKPVKNAIDGTAFILSYYLAFVVRFEGNIAGEPWEILKASLPYVVFFKFLCCVLFNLQNLTWRYVSIIEVRRITQALTIASGVLACLSLFHRSLLFGLLETGHGALPLGVILIDWFLSLLFLLGVRVTTRMWLAPRRGGSLKRNPQDAVATVLIGAGHAGALVVKEILSRRNLGIKPIGFLDDDPT